MKVVKNNELESITGGNTISGTVLNAITGFVKLLYEVGHDFGSAIRRIGTGNICPLE